MAVLPAIVSCSQHLSHPLAQMTKAGAVACSMNANKLVSIYKALLSQCSPGNHAPASYNLVLSKDHMLLVPRRKETVGSVGINALGFAGTVVVNSKDGLQFIHDEGPISILEAAGVPWQQTPP